MKLVCLLALRIYRRFLTRYTPRCPMTPSCSTYAYDAISQHGARVGLEMAVDYLYKCGKEVPRDQEPAVRDEGGRGRAAQLGDTRSVPGSARLDQGVMEGMR